MILLQLTGGQYGLQPSCSIDDISGYNICLDLTSQSGMFESWMTTAIDAAARWESIITGNLPSEPTAGLGQPPMPPDLPGDCTAYPPTIDDMYICVQNVDFASDSQTVGIRTVGFGGPFLQRNINKINDRTGEPFPLTYAARVGISNSFLASGSLGPHYAARNRACSRLVSLPHFKLFIEKFGMLALTSCYLPSRKSFLLAVRRRQSC